jgi:hypothetical protein
MLNLFWLDAHSKPKKIPSQSLFDDLIARAKMIKIMHIRVYPDMARLLYQGYFKIAFILSYLHFESSRNTSNPI